jgi:hypothetical protein
MPLGYFLLGFLTALVIVAVLILAFYLRFKRAGRKNSNIKGYLDLIPDLSAEQRSKVQSIRQTFLPKVERIRQELCRLRIVLAGALFSEITDREKARSIAQDILKSQSELEQEVIDHIIEEKDLLSPKQQRKFFEIILDQFAHGGLGVHDIKQRRKG